MKFGVCVIGVELIKELVLPVFHVPHLANPLGLLGFLPRSARISPSLSRFQTPAAWRGLTAARQKQPRQPKRIAPNNSNTPVLLLRTQLKLR